MSELIYIVVLIIISFMLRFLFILVKSTDEDIALWIIKNSKQCVTNSKINSSILKGYWRYPSLPHYIVSLFPDQYQFLFGKFLNIFYDIISIILAYCIAKYIFNDILKINDMNLPFFSSILMATMPIFFPVNARLKAIGGRVFGGLLVLLYMVLIMLFYVEHNYIFLIISAVLFLLIIMSSQFALQFAVFATMFIALFLKQLDIFIMLIIILIGSYIFMNNIKRILFGKYLHYRYYLSNIKGTTADGRNNLKDFLRLPYFLFKNPKKFFSIVFYKNTYLIAIYSIPDILFLFLLINFDNYVYNVVIKKELFFMNIWVGAGIVAFFLTSWNKLSFLGQAERYLEYIIVPFSILEIYALYLYDKSNVVINVFILTLIHIIIILSVFFVLMYNNILNILKNKTTKEFDQMVKYLKNFTNKKIFTIPTKIAYKFSAFDNNNIYNLGDSMIFTSFRLDGLGYLIDDWLYAMVVNPDLIKIKNKYKVDFFLIEKSYLESVKSKGIYYPLNQMQVIFENKEYILASYGESKCIQMEKNLA